MFAAALLSLTSSGGLEQQTTSTRARAVSELSECLLIYESLDRWEAAEDVIRQDIVVPFVKKVSFSATVVRFVYQQLFSYSL